MIKKIGILALICVLILSCENKLKPERPDNLIPKDKMSDILYDLYLINAAKGVNKKLLEENGFVPETYILTKYNIDSLQFASSNTFYAFEPEIYKAIVEKAKARLEKDKAKYEEIKIIEGQKAKRKRDSIRAISKNNRDSIPKKKPIIKN